MLALKSDLISEYIAFQRGKQTDYNYETILKLFRYLHPFKMSVKQKDEIGLKNDE